MKDALMWSLQLFGLVFVWAVALGVVLAVIAYASALWGQMSAERYVRRQADRRAKASQARLGASLNKFAKDRREKQADRGDYVESMKGLNI